jgi:hypothetical protein
MAATLDFERKKVLAAGLLRLLWVLFSVKSVLICLHLGAEGPSKAMMVGSVLLVMAALLLGTSALAKRRPALAKVGLLLIFPVICFMQLGFLVNLWEMGPWIGILAVAEQLPLGVALLLLSENPDSKYARWAATHRRLSRGLMMALRLSVAFVVLELLLRSFGFTPNTVRRTSHFQQVDELVTYGDFATDADGIFAWSPNAIRFLNTQIASSPTVVNRAAVDTCMDFHSPNLYEAYTELHAGKLHNEFARWIKKIEGKPSAERTEYEAAARWQTYHPLNDAGFRSVAFRSYPTTSKKVLLLGDSFTFGQNAENLTSAFADILMARGYAVFNSGISSTDPAQYEAVAKKYIPILKPDVVVVNFFMGNDIFYFRRPVEPYRMSRYACNAGMIMAYPSVEWLPNTEAAYAFLCDEYGIPKGAGWFGAICGKTAVTTLLWRTLRALNLIGFAAPNAEYWARCQPLESKTPVSGQHLKAIETIATENGAAFVLAAIPELDSLSRHIPADYPGLFDGLEVHVPNLERTDYTGEVSHFGDVGHMKYANFLQSLINDALAKRDTAATATGK